MRTRVPNVTGSNNGTNLNGEINQEFEKRMGASPRFSKPIYPQSNGLVERFNKTLKGRKVKCDFTVIAGENGSSP